MTVTQLLVAALAVAGLSTIAGIWAFQTYGIYTFSSAVETPTRFGYPSVRVVRFSSTDGVAVTAWVADPAEDRPVILSLYGNGASIGSSMERMALLMKQGYGLVMMEYRSSGETSGKPSELNFVRDASALYDQLDTVVGQMIPVEQRVLHGFSLGAGVGSRLAAERPFAAVVLEASPLRTCLYYQDRYLGIPFCSLMWAERYDVVDHVMKISAPKLFVHGVLDEALPVERARLLFAAAPDPKEYVEIPEGHHADLDQLGLIPAMQAFIDKWVGAAKS